MEILIVGAGEMGRWFAGAVEDDVAFADVDESAAEAAAHEVRQTAGRRARAVPLDADESFGTVCLAVPMSDVESAVETHAGKSQQAVVDVAGVQGGPLRAMARTVPSRERASFHPLFSAANAPGTVAVSTGASGPATDRIRAALSAAGNDLVEVDAGVHDEAMETVQGRAHAAILAFALAADEVPEALATPVYDDLAALVAQVTGGTPRVYADVQATYGGAAEVAAAAERLAESVGEDAGAFADLYEEASEAVRGVTTGAVGDEKGTEAGRGDDGGE